MGMNEAARAEAEALAAQFDREDAEDAARAEAEDRLDAERAALGLRPKRRRVQDIKTYEGFADGSVSPRG